MSERVVGKMVANFGAIEETTTSSGADGYRARHVVSMVSASLEPSGATVFTTITAQARAVGAIDLGQGYPSWDGPEFVNRAEVAAVEHESNRCPLRWACLS